MNHPDQLERYPGTLVELAEDIGNLRYDALADFLQALSAKLGQDADADAKRGRPKLATALRSGAEAAGSAAASIERAWTISSPYM